MKATLGLAVITKNEERNIEECLNSVPFASEKIVVDSQSTDKTVQLAEKAGAKVIVREWPGYPKQKQFALDQINADWILVLDADEYLTAEAQKEILDIIQSSDACEAYRIPRFEFFMNKVIRHGKGVDYPLRLIKKGKGNYTNREVHEEILVNGKCGYMKGGMIHKSSVDVLSRLEKIKRDLNLEKQYLGNEPVSLATLFLGPVRFFLSYFFKQRTWKDGIPGTIWLLLFSIQIFLHHSLQYEKSNAFKK